MVRTSVPALHIYGYKCVPKYRFISLIDKRKINEEDNLTKIHFNLGRFICHIPLLLFSYCDW